MQVMKFGGTSVGTATNIRGVENIITSNEKKIVVLSAMSGTTNSLVEIASRIKKGNHEGALEIVNDLKQHYLSTAKELSSDSESFNKLEKLLNSEFEILAQKASEKYSDQLEKEIVVTGEIITTKMITLYLKGKGVNVELLWALNFMRTDNNGEPDYYYVQESINREINKYPNCNLFITQGFICKTMKGEVSNLTRGGSDYSATIIGAAIHASEVIIWSDKDGLLNCDPRFVEQTYPLKTISYEEAEELAYFGAKILHPSCIFPVKGLKIPVFLKNTMNPQAPGTLISADSIGQKGEIIALAAKDDVVAIYIKSASMLNAYGFLLKIFNVFNMYRTSVDMITTSEVAVAVTITDTTHLHDIVRELSKFGEIEYFENQTIICAVGNIPAQQSDISVKIFEAMSDIQIKMISYGASKRNITMLIDSKDKTRALNNLNKNLFKDKLCSVKN
ncbi:MAG: aspartate kinase [Bacteroidales bacterium]|nr:aspartate kinase [Bacteroidales bacterium]